jgi:hypothetical protein
MRKKVLRAVATISFVVAIGMMMAGSAQAQSLAASIRVHIPFDFQFADTRLPAGDYYVGRLPNSSSDSVVMISNVQDGQTAIRLTNAVQTASPKEKGTLIFHRYGDQYFLFQVWPAGGETGRALPTSRREREVQNDKDLVGTNKRAEVDTLIVITGQR